MRLPPDKYNNFFLNSILLSQGITQGSLWDNLKKLFPSGGLSGQTTAGGLITSVVQLLLFFAGSIAVIFLIWGGFSYIMSRGNDEATEKAKKTIESSVIGLIVIILSFALVYIVSNLVTGRTGL